MRVESLDLYFAIDNSGILIFCLEDIVISNCHFEKKTQTDFFILKDY